MICPAAWECDHAQMTECCEGCGHFSCPCGITWDENFEGGPFAYDSAQEVEDWIIEAVKKKP